MKDIPVFTTPYGVASLLLKEVPYRSMAYVRIQTVQPGMLRELVNECAAFCRMAGADRVLASGAEELEDYPLHHSILSMSGPADFSPEATIVPVTKGTVTHWREIYNHRMRAVDGAATMTLADEKEILSGNASFVCKEDALLGIGWTEAGKLLSIASVIPGAGATVLKTLLSTLNGDRVTLEVASTNLSAIRLYESVGFVCCGVRTRWYRVL